MKHLSQIVCTSLIALSLFLIVPVLTVHGQQARVSDQTEPAQRDAQVFTPVSLVEGSLSPPKLERKHLLYRTVSDEGNWSLVNHPTATLQQTASPAGGYVFPSRRQRLNQYLWETFGPLTLIGVGVAAGIDQGQNNPPEWKQGASGFGKRFGFSARLGDALIQNVTSRTRTGKRIISAPRLAGVYVGGLVPALTWYPSRFSYKDGLREGTYSLAAGFALNVLREFIFHR